VKSDEKGKFKQSGKERVTAAWFLSRGSIVREKDGEGGGRGHENSIAEVEKERKNDGER